VGSDPDVEGYAPDLGPMNLLFLVSRARWIFRVTFSMTYPHERRLISQVAGMDARKATTAAGDWGKYDPHSTFRIRKPINGIVPKA